MRKTKRCRALACAATAVLGVNAAAQAALYIYEPFNYTAGQPITGQMNTTSALPETWLSAGTVAALPANQHQIGSAGLSGGVQPNAGNDGDVKQSDGGELNRLNLPFAVGFGTNPGPTFANGSTLYYSLLLNIPSTGITTLTVANTNSTANNDVLIALNNAQGSQTGRPNSWNGELVIKKGGTAGTFDLGIHASTATANTTGFTGDLTTDTTYFVVVEAQINAADTDGTNNLWVNPLPATWGANELTRPAPDKTDNGLGSAAGWSMQSLLVGSGIGAGDAPADALLDEIRVGDTWADVTTNNAPLAIPEPAGLSLLAFGALGLWRRRRR